MSNYSVYFKTHPNVEFKGFEKKVLSFIKNRLSYFLDGTISFHQYKNIDSPKGDTIIAISLLNPILDEKLLNKMIYLASENNKIVKSTGAVPGTAPLFVASVESLQKKSDIFEKHCTTQLHYNSQLNLGRLKRIKVFQKFLDKFPDFYKTPLEEILKFCGTPEGVEFVLSYTSSMKMNYFKSCPSCGNKKSIPIYSNEGTPVTGFLTRFSEYYFMCQGCSLVFLNPTLPDEELWCYYDIYSYPPISEITSLKTHYNTLSRNNVSTYYNFEAVSNDLKQLPLNASALDIGGGIGEFSIYLQQNYPSFQVQMWDFRIDGQVSKELSRRGIQGRSCNFLDEPIEKGSYDLISNWEVIEHLPVPRLEAYLKKIAKALKQDGLYIISTPDFDSPYAKALDFWACFPGEHLSVFSRSVLEPILNKCGLNIIKEYHESVTMDFPEDWFLYGLESNASLESRSQATIINDFLKCDSARKIFRQYMRKNNLGSELILCLKKIGYE